MRRRKRRKQFGREDLGRTLPKHEEVMKRKFGKVAWDSHEQMIRTHKKRKLRDRRRKLARAR